MFTEKDVLNALMDKYNDVAEKVCVFADSESDLEEAIPHIDTSCIALYTGGTDHNFGDNVPLQEVIEQYEKYIASIDGYKNYKVVKFTHYLETTQNIAELLGRTTDAKICNIDNRWFVRASGWRDITFFYTVSEDGSVTINNAHSVLLRDTYKQEFTNHFPR